MNWPPGDVFKKSGNGDDPDFANSGLELQCLHSLYEYLG